MVNEEAKELGFFISLTDSSIRDQNESSGFKNIQAEYETLSKDFMSHEGRYKYYPFLSKAAITNCLGTVARLKIEAGKKYEQQRELVELYYKSS